MPATTISGKAAAGDSTWSGAGFVDTIPPVSSPTAGGETPRTSSSKSSKDSSKSDEDEQETIAVAIGRTRNHDATSNHATNHATTHWERDHPGENEEEYQPVSMDHQEETIEVAAAVATGRTRNHDATSNHATDHASTRWERDHPNQQGEMAGTEERVTRDHASTRWEREHPDDEQAE